jgi:hypothetical protein
MIRQAMTQMPDAPYYLVQTVLIQDLSLHNAQNRITELEKQVASINAPQQQQPTSFLGGLFGRSQPAPAPSVPQSGGPWTRVQQPAPPPPQYAQPGYAQPGYAQAAPAAGVFGGGAAAGGGNSFLRSAATTAAGVAGGALLFEGISSLFGHGFAGGLGGYGGMGGMQGGLGETVINNYYGDNQGGGAPGDYGGGGDNAGGGDYGGGGDTGGGDYSGGGDSGGDYGGGGDFGGGGDSGDSGGGSDSSSC